MRYRSIRFVGIRPYAGEVFLDLDSIPGPIVAIHGPNGSGKSTLCEMLATGAYRRTPTHGRIVDMATTRDAYVEVVVENGQTYTVRHKVDAVSRKGTSEVTGPAGPVFDTGKSSDFDAWAKVVFPPREVYFAGAFSAQESDGLLKMDGSDRMRTLLRAIGCERYEVLAKIARDKAAAVAKRLDVLAARIADEQVRGLDVAVAEQELVEARARAAGADAELEQAKAELARVEEEARIAREARTAFETHVDRTAMLRNLQLEVLQRIGDLEKRIANNRMVLDDADRIRAAVSDIPTLRQGMEDLRVKCSDAAHDVRAFETESLSWLGRSKDAERRVTAASARVQSARYRLAGREAVERAVAELERLRDAVGVAAQEHLAATEAYEALASQTVAGLGERIDGLRGGLQRIADLPATIENAQDIAARSLDADDTAARLAIELPRLKIEAVERWDKARIALDKARSQLSTAEATASRAPDLDLAQQDLDAAQVDARTATEEALAHVRRSKDAQAKADAASNSMHALGDAVCAAEDRLAKAEALAARAKHIDSAQARIEELALQLAAANADRERIEADMEAMDRPPVVPPTPNVEPSTLALRQAERAARDAHAAPPVREHALKQATESVAKLYALAAERAAVETEIGDWTKLAESLRDLQSLEIDAAGPELTELTNDFLRSCVGDRWSVSWETTRMDSKGKRELDDCHISVLDTEEGREANGKEFSPGQRAVVELGCSLALTTYSCRKLGIERPTLVRDESDAPMTEEASAAFIPMLRRAAKLIDADKVLIITHRPNTVELADARVLVADGKVEVQV